MKLKRAAIALMVTIALSTVAAGPAAGNTSATIERPLMSLISERVRARHAESHKDADPVPSIIECTTSPSSAQNVLLDCPDDNFLSTNESPIEIDPTDPLHMIAGAIDWQGCCNEFYVTFDGGRTWTSGDMSMQDADRLQADPAISFDVKHGTAIFAQQSFDVTAACDAGEEAAVSTDGGLNWGAPVGVFGGHWCSDPPDFFDKDWMTTENNPASPYYGRTYITTSHVACANPECSFPSRFPIVESHSDDGGYTWSPMQEISGSDPAVCTGPPDPPACDNDSGSFPVVSPDGSVHVAFVSWNNRTAWEPGECCETQYLVVSSTDGGVTWSDPVHVADKEDGNRDYPATDNKGSDTVQVRLTGTALGLGYPGVGVAPFGNMTVNPVDGTLYIVFSDNRNGTHDVDNPVTNADVFVMTSTDGGKTWTGPDAVSSAPGDQWQAFAAVNPVDGSLGVAYYSRTSSHSQGFDLVLAEGRPGSFKYTNVTTAPSPMKDDLWFPAGVSGCQTCVTFMGDYLGLAYAPDGTANLVWTDLRRHVTVPGVGSGFTENIFYASL